VNLNAKQFDLCNARACARASADAYQRTTISVTGTDTHALIVESPDCIIIAFRGSVSIRNWITDAEFARVTVLAGMTTTVKIHAGFNAAMNSILVPLITTVRGKRGELQMDGGAPSQKPIFLTGHSLGGALAVLAAIALHRAGFEITQVYTFGQPRVGNSDFKDWYNLYLGWRTFRMVYQEDIVPRIPHLPAFRDPYRHVGQEVFVPSVSPVQTMDDLWFNPPLWRLLMSDIWGLYRAWLVSKFDAALDPARDHHVGNYTGTLAAIINPPIQQSNNPSIQTDDSR
jgi:triacylglycerol lipase